jgi:hypothetical protein
MTLKSKLGSPQRPHLKSMIEQFNSQKQDQGLMKKATLKPAGQSFQPHIVSEKA